MPAFISMNASGLTPMPDGPGPGFNFDPGTGVNVPIGASTVYQLGAPVPVACACNWSFQNLNFYLKATLVYYEETTPAGGETTRTGPHEKPIEINTSWDGAPILGDDGTGANLTGGGAYFDCASTTQSNEIDFGDYIMVKFVGEVIDGEYVENVWETATLRWRVTVNVEILGPYETIFVDAVDSGTGDVYPGQSSWLPVRISITSEFIMPDPYFAMADEVGSEGTKGPTNASEWNSVWDSGTHDPYVPGEGFPARTFTTVAVGGARITSFGALAGPVVLSCVALDPPSILNLDDFKIGVYHAHGTRGSA